MRWIVAPLILILLLPFSALAQEDEEETILDTILVSGQFQDVTIREVVIQIFEENGVRYVLPSYGMDITCTAHLENMPLGETLEVLLLDADMSFELFSENLITVLHGGSTQGTETVTVIYQVENRPAQSLSGVVEMVLQRSRSGSHIVDGDCIVITGRASLVDELVDEILPELDRPLTE